MGEVYCGRTKNTRARQEMLEGVFCDIVLGKNIYIMERATIMFSVAVLGDVIANSYSYEL